MVLDILHYCYSNTFTHTNSNLTVAVKLTRQPSKLLYSVETQLNHLRLINRVWDSSPVVFNQLKAIRIKVPFGCVLKPLTAKNNQLEGEP